MNTALFVQWLARELDDSEGAAYKRHIIRFRSARHYTACVKQIKRHKTRESRLGSVQCLNLINAISCSLRTGAELTRNKMIHSIETDVKIKVHASRNIASFQSPKMKRPRQHNAVPWGVRHIKAPQVWKRSTGDQIHIGVIDTGVDYSHPDLKHALSRGINLINRHMMPTDDNGHGTHIAGTIAAASRQSGMSGVAPQAVIHPVKAFDHQGSAYVSDIISGIDWCVNNRLHIINMSFGMKSYSKALEAAVKNAYNSGTIVVASSGNESKKASIDYPARFRHTISVGATAKGRKIAPFSNRGRLIDIYAPGDKIYSTWLRGKYNELSGTSMATSHVSGVIALMLSARPGLRPPQIKSILLKNSIPIVSALKTGAKEVHALRAFQALSNSKQRPATPPPF